MRTPSGYKGEIVACSGIPRSCPVPRVRLAIVVTTALLTLGSVLPARAETPTEDDFRTCNAEADAAVKSGTTAPTSKDHARADAQRKSEGSARAGSGVDDPQLRGMARERADDPSYQAAYRTCMRRNGF
jgi:hypothetical protein